MAVVISHRIKAILGVLECSILQQTSPVEVNFKNDGRIKFNLNGLKFQYVSPPSEFHALIRICLYARRWCKGEVNFK